jgi:hypothetical protein
MAGKIGVLPAGSNPSPRGHRGEQTNRGDQTMKIIVAALAALIVLAAFVLSPTFDPESIRKRAQANVDHLNLQTMLMKSCKANDVAACRELCLDPPSGTDVPKCWELVRILERKEQLKAEMRAICERISPARRPAECRS